MSIHGQKEEWSLIADMKRIIKKKKIRIIVLVILLGIILLAAGCFAYLRPKEAEPELPVSEDGYYEIDSAEDFYLFWEEICIDDEYARGRLMKDICLNNISDVMDWKEWEDLRLCRGAEVFSGVFDGNGHTIYGVYSNRGYSLAMKNKGKICNLFIRDSIIYGNYNPQFIWGACGGICKENSGVISKCEFGGKLYASAASGGKLSGICSRNLGIIEQCGFSGIVAVDGEYFDGEVSGICAENQGEIVRCYNMTRLNKVTLQPGQSKCFSVITDQGEKQCFAFKDSGWDFPESGQTAALGWQQAEDIPLLIHENLYGLLVKDKKPGEKQELQEILNDEVILDLIMELITTKGENWRSLSLEVEFSEESALLTLSDGADEVTISIYPAWQERAYWREEADYERLWQQCAEILGEKDTESFEHSSWQMVSGQEGEETVFGNFIRFQTNKGRWGFFLQKDQRLYRIESKESQEKASELYDTMLRKLWDGRTPSMGISWRCEEIREAALAGLEDAREQDTDAEQEIWEMPPSREELCALETLLIDSVKTISSLEDLAKMPHLKSLSFLGDESSYINYDLEKGMVPELEELWISGVQLSNLDFLEQLPQLKSLFVWDCGLEDISGVRYQKELTTVFLDWNSIWNIRPLQNCKKLKIISFSNNRVKDISALESLSQLEEIVAADNEIASIEPLQWLGNLKSFSGDGNKIRNIDALKYLPELQDLNLADNQIEDFAPITGLTNLRDLDIRNNPGQNIGDLIFLPGLIFGNGTYYKYNEAEEWEEAQTILESFYPQEALLAKDMVKGDLNGDGIPDIVIAVLNEESEDSEGDGFGKIYVFWGKEDGTLRRLPAIDIFDSGYGVYFYGMLITDGKLAVQAGYSGFSEEHRHTAIYEYKKGKIREKWNLEFIDDDYLTPGFDFRITDRENQQETYYVIVEDKGVLRWFQEK